MLKRLIGAAALLAAVGTAPAAAQEVTLKIHHFLPPSSNAHENFIQPWADRIEEESGGRIAFEIYPAMQLGGRPPQLYDQARDGVADIVWTLPGYTPGRFPTIEVFELPFVAGSAEATSQAVQEFYETHLQDEFQDVKVLAVWTHAPGAFHMRGAPIEKLEDLRGRKVRAPTRVVNDALAAMGATPVGMPVPQVPEALSKGVVDGTVLPYEVTAPLRVHELTDSHTDVDLDGRGFYTAVFIYAMNEDRYESLPDDLKAIIDRNSGMALAKQLGQIWDSAEQPGIEAAQLAGNSFHTIEGEEAARWKEAAQPATEAWIKAMDEQGKDGKALLAEAEALVKKYAEDAE